MPKPDPFDNLHAGSRVLYVLDGGEHGGESRGAVVTRVLDDFGLVNLTVFVDFEDTPAGSPVATLGIMRRASVALDSTGEKPNTWHFEETT